MKKILLITFLLFVGCSQRYENKVLEYLKYVEQIGDYQEVYWYKKNVMKVSEQELDDWMNTIGTLSSSYKDRYLSSDCDCREFDSFAINIEDYKIIKTESNNVYVSIDYFDYDHSPNPKEDRLQFYSIKNNIDVIFTLDKKTLKISKISPSRFGYKSIFDN